MFQNQVHFKPTHNFIKPFNSNNEQQYYYSDQTNHQFEYCKHSNIQISNHIDKQIFKRVQVNKQPINQQINNIKSYYNSKQLTIYKQNRQSNHHNPIYNKESSNQHQSPTNHNFFRKTSQQSIDKLYQNKSTVNGSHNRNEDLIVTRKQYTYIRNTQSHKNIFVGQKYSNDSNSLKSIKKKTLNDEYYITISGKSTAGASKLTKSQQIPQLKLKPRQSNQTRQTRDANLSTESIDDCSYRLKTNKYIVRTEENQSQSLYKQKLNDVIIQSRNMEAFKKFVQFHKINQKKLEIKKTFKIANTKVENNFINGFDNLSTKYKIQDFFMKNKKKSKLVQFVKKLLFLSRKVKQLGLDSIIDMIDQKVISDEVYEKKNSYEFMKATKQNDIDKVKEYLGINRFLVFDFDHQKMTCLHWSCRLGYLELTNLFYQYHADLNAKDMVGRTPLFTAIKNGHIEVVKRLLFFQCSPWSQSGFVQINEAYADHDQEYIQRVSSYLKIARRLDISIKMTTSKQIKAKIWNEHRFQFK